MAKSEKKPPEKQFGTGRLSMFEFEPNLDEVEEVLTGRIHPSVGDVVIPSPPEVKDERS